MAAKQGGETARLSDVADVGQETMGTIGIILVFLADMDIWDVLKNWVYPKKPKTMAI